MAKKKIVSVPSYNGPDRRSGSERRSASDRRTSNPIKITMQDGTVRYVTKYYDGPERRKGKRRQGERRKS